MKLEGEQVLLRLFVNVNDKYAGIFPLYRYLFKQLKKMHMSGATVIKGFYGFLRGEDFKEKDGLFSKSSYCVCIDVVDSPERINNFLVSEEEHLQKLIITAERARVILYSSEHDDRQTFEKKVSFIQTSDESKKHKVMLMNAEEKVLIRVFIGDSDREKSGESYLYEYIVNEAKRIGFDLSFAYKGIMGFGKSARLRDVETIEFSSNIPLCVEIIGDDAKTKEFLTVLNQHIESGLITVEKVIFYKK